MSFDAAGKTWTLEITNRTERALQTKLKAPMGDIISRLRNGDAEDLLAIFTEALKKHHPDVTADDAIDLVRPKQLRNIVGELLRVTYGGDEDPPQPGQEDATGSAN